MDNEKEMMENLDTPQESLNARSRRNRDRKREQRKGKNGKGMVIGIIILVVIIGIIAVLVKKYAPSKKVMELTEYYQIPKDEVMVVLHDKIAENNGIYEEGQIYLPYDMVVDQINKRFYFDTTENILSYTTASEVIRAEVGSNDYYMNKSKASMECPIVKTNGTEVYLSLEFMKELTDVEYEFYEEPNRVVIENGTGKTYSYYRVVKYTQLRVGQSIKSDIVAKLSENDVLCVLESEEELVEGYVKVITKDGVEGYVQTKYLSEQYEEATKEKYNEAYPHISKEQTINMAWHQVTTYEANNNLLNTIAPAKGLNVISPTWFSISSNKGDVTSLASETYVSCAHDNGLEVWALCDDFKAADGEIDLATILGVTSNRDKLVNRLLANAFEYNLDGINIDFEHITADTADAYLQFLRELSVKCRNNGIILSVDSYVPTEYTSFYDREEQGKVVDYVVVMAYDEHYGGSEESGSVASIGFVENAVNKIVEMVDPSQVIIAMPFYTRLWKETTENDKVTVTSSAYSMSQIESILEQNGVSAQWDEETGQYYAEYEANGSVYKVWLEEEESIERKLKTIFEEREQGVVAGVSSWKIGLEKPVIWNTIIKYTN